MKYCIKCGLQLEDDSIFCPVCGMQQTQPQNVQPEYPQMNAQPQYPQMNDQAQYPQAYPQQQFAQPQYPQQQYPQQQYPQVYPQQQYGYGAPNNAAGYGNAAAPVLPQVKAGDKADGKVKEGKSKKKFIVIPVIVVLLAALGVGSYFLFFRKNKKDPTEKQVQVLDAYFEALSDMDFDAIYKLNSPNSDERFNLGTDRVPLSELLIDTYGYYRGNIDQSTYMYGRFREMFMDSYGFPDHDLDEYREVMRDSDLFREHHADFTAEYDLISLKNASECKISFGRGRKTVDDMRAYIADKMDLDVDDIYVAKIHIYWRYGDLEYGFDSSWWRNEDYKKIMEESGPYDESTGEKAKTYGECVDYYDNLEYDVFLYEVDGEWYIYNINMRENGYGWSVE